ncbi:MAG: hypothetical protein JJ896_16740 [Rhodothermales bacterium]|nr:hypothetical protein [Rhodothermales bacterium]MBO6781306.1 hypothetical protein [Rhodothermales bacterium]
MSASSSAGVRGRIEAVERLIRIQDEGAFAGLVGRAGLPKDVERVATAFVGNVTRWKRWLDHLAETCYRGEYRSLEPAVRELLRVGTYDLAVAGTAPHAAVHQAVEAARLHVRPGAGKLVNAVLRALDRKKPWLSFEDDGSADALAVRWSHPTWMVKRWLRRFGVDDTRALLMWNNRPPAYSVRVAAERGDLERFLEEEHVPWRSSRWLDDYVQVDRLQPLVRAGWIQRGDAVVQDESAGLIVRLVDAQAGETIVDACAAPGGKSRYLIERMDRSGRLIAIDASASRLRLLEDMPGPIERVAADFRDWASSHQGMADRVLVDAPCTGLGVLAGRADLRWRRSPEDFAQLAPLQRELMDAAAGVVRPGGLFVYSTCSIAPEENELQAEAFLERHAGFEAESALDSVPDKLVTDAGHLATLPQRDGIDGAFGARFRRLG